MTRDKTDSYIWQKARPLGDRVLVKHTGVISDSKTQGENILRGEVVAVSEGERLPDGRLRKLDVELGDQVGFPKYSGAAIRLDGEDYVILREYDILIKLL